MRADDGTGAIPQIARQESGEPVLRFAFNPQRRRLWVEIDVRWVDNAQRLESGDSGTQAHAQAARVHLERARACARRRNGIDEGWQHVFAADEELICTFSYAEVLETARALDRETRSAAKISGWRQEVIQAMLQPILRDPVSRSGERELRSARQILRCAAHLRNEGVSNRFWLLGIVRHHQLALIAIAIMALAPFIPMLVMWLATDTGAPLKSWHAPLLAICSGVLGAVVSAAQRSTKIEGRSIPLQLGSYVASFSRIPLGAIAGLTAWLLALSTAAAGTSPQASMLLAAFGAGFAERLVVENGSPVPAAPDRRVDDRANIEELLTALKNDLAAATSVMAPDGSTPAQPTPAAGRSGSPGASGGG